MLKIIVYSLIIYLLYLAFTKKKKPTPEELAQQEAERKRLQEVEAERKRKEKERRQALEKEKKEAEIKLLREIEQLTRRLYFSYSLVNENSPIYLINPTNNEIIESSETTLNNLYAQGWKLYDIDKTGKSAQLTDFNFILRLQK